MIPKSTTVSTPPDVSAMSQTSPTDNETGRACNRRRASSTIDSSRSNAVTLAAPRRSRITSAPTPCPHPTSNTCCPDKSPPASRLTTLLRGDADVRPAPVAASAVMRILVQRVTSASVTVGGDVVGAITPNGQGLLALVGVTHTDDPAKAQRLAEKLWQLRILDEEKSAGDVGAPILVVSQFTLYANTAKGRRPTWNAAAPGAVAEPLVTVFADALRQLGAEVETGVFGADMQVALVNDGPVTVLL